MPSDLKMHKQSIHGSVEAIFCLSDTWLRHFSIDTNCKPGSLYSFKHSLLCFRQTEQQGPRWRHHGLHWFYFFCYWWFTFLFISLVLFRWLKLTIEITIDMRNKGYFVLNFPLTLPFFPYIHFCKDLRKISQSGRSTISQLCTWLKQEKKFQLTVGRIDK